MHIEARDFVARTKARFPAHFANGRRVLDVGSLDMNGNNRFLFDPTCIYQGIDIVSGSNVDHVCAAGDFCADEAPAQYDTVVSTECFTYDLDFVRSLRNIVRLLKPGGLFVFTCATTGRPEHGLWPRPHDVVVAQSTVDWYPTYLHTLTPEDIQRAVPIHVYFDAHSFEIDTVAKDMHFWGVRNAVLFDPSCAAAEQRSHATAARAFGSDEAGAAIAGRALPGSCENDARPSLQRRPLQTAQTIPYHGLVDRFRFTPNVRLLRLGGLADGNAGLCAARTYLPNATHIIGIDSVPDCARFQVPDKHVFVKEGALVDRAFLESVVAQHGPFDIVFDDRHQHHHATQQRDTPTMPVAAATTITFEILFPLLKDGGLYLVRGTQGPSDRWDDVRHAFCRYAVRDTRRQVEQRKSTDGDPFCASTDTRSGGAFGPGAHTSIDEPMYAGAVPFHHYGSLTGTARPGTRMMRHPAVDWIETSADSVEPATHSIDAAVDTATFGDTFVAIVKRPAPI